MEDSEEYECFALGALSYPGSLGCLAIAASLITIYLGLRFQWNREAKRDSAAFDLLISTGGIDRIEMATFDFNRDSDETNVLTGADAQKFLRAFVSTNRSAKPDLTKAQEMRLITLMRNTNVIDYISQYENSLWRFREYSFLTRTP